MSHDYFTKKAKTRAELLNDLAFRQYPKSLSIAKIWEGEYWIDLLVNTNYNSHYLIHLEPGNYSVTFGELYGIGNIAYKNVIGTCIDPYCLERFQQLKNPGLVRYKTKKHYWGIFGHFTETELAIWLDRGSYSPSLVIKKR